MIMTIDWMLDARNEAELVDLMQSNRAAAPSKCGEIIDDCLNRAPV